MKTLSGLDIVSRKLPAAFADKNLGILCHAPSINSQFVNIIDILNSDSNCHISAMFGPQHGLYGQTQDNMIEWEGVRHPTLGIPVYSLYGEHRKPSKAMLADIDLFLIDLQDVGARLYTYIWTVKLCMEACAEIGIPVYILDRPNPIGKVQCDGPVLKKEFFTFVGGAEIPMCHRMTIGEMAIWIKTFHLPGCDLHVIPMEGWKRNSTYRDTGLPWVLPSPNMPTQEAAIVYPGTVLFEAMNISEGRGTVIPFELFGAPFLNTEAILKELKILNLPGCAFRTHDYIPTFNKYQGDYCKGIQIHIIDASVYKPVETMLEILSLIYKTSPTGSIRFNPPPYEYEYNHIPFDILSGDSRMRMVIEQSFSLKQEKERWREEIAVFESAFKQVALYKE